MKLKTIITTLSLRWR